MFSCIKEGWQPVHYWIAGKYRKYWERKAENTLVAGITVVLWYSPIDFGLYFLVFVGVGYDICMK